MAAVTPQKQQISPTIYMLIFMLIAEATIQLNNINFIYLIFLKLFDLFKKWWIIQKDKRYKNARMCVCLER